MPNAFPSAMPAFRRLAPLMLAAALAGCATVPRLRAADDVHALLLSVRDGDRAAFEAHVDRPALKAQLKSRLIVEGAKRGGDWAAVGVSLVGPVVDIGVDLLVRPDTFRAEAIRLGYDPNAPAPGVLAVAALVKPLGAGGVCVQDRRGGPCVLSFLERDGTYRLSGYEGPLDRLLGPERKPPPRPAKPR